MRLIRRYLPTNRNLDGCRADPVAVPPGDQPVAVVLDLGTHAEPLGAFWEGLGRQGGILFWMEHAFGGALVFEKL